MNFTTVKFLCFLAAVAVLYRAAPVRFRALVLLCASYGFYWSWSGSMAVLLFGATVAAYVAGRVAKRGWMLLVAIGLVSLLALFKAAPYWPGGIVMPLGVSYYSFKLISYVLDVYWGTFAAEKAFIPFAAYVSFFPQIVAGPIQRSESFLPQMHGARPARFSDVVLGVQRILLGYFKKLVVADNLALVTSGAAFYAYPLQMYADFSGLTDIAIGSAWLLGIESPENFNAPFSAVSPSEYWRRWHITLTTWLTDYVFTPLRLATRAFGNAGLVFSLVVNMVLIGLWHGFRWSFAMFGLVHAVYLSVDALTARMRKKYYKAHPAADRLTNWTGPIVTFHLVAIGAVFFRSEHVGDAFSFLGHMGAGMAAPLPDSVLVGCGGYVLLELADHLRRRNRRGELVEALPRWGRWSVYSCTALTALFVIMLLLAGGRNRNPFLYAIF